MSQIDVEGNIVGTTPIIGPVLQRVLIGGNRVGNLTLTHLYFLHVALLPLFAVLLLGVHIWQVYRHGLAAEPVAGGSSRRLSYWPHQTARNMIVLSVVLGTVAVLAWKVGAPLEVPADPEIAHSPRPEWYFLSLFELRRYFNGPWEVVATVVIPLALLLVSGLPPADRCGLFAAGEHGLSSRRCRALLRRMGLVDAFLDSPRPR